jgi:large subunit ribosomal protein L30
MSRRAPKKEKTDLTLDLSIDEANRLLELLEEKPDLLSQYDLATVKRVPKKLYIKLVKSPIGYSQDQRATVRSLGLRKMNSTVVQNNTPQIRGMVNKVRHLVKVKEI